MPSKGQKISEVHKKRLSLANTKNRKCSVEGCNDKHHGKGFCKNHYQQNYKKENPEYASKQNTKNLERYYKNHEANKLKKRVAGKSIQSEIVTLLGGKCVSCDEKFNPKLPRSNLHIHHKFYSKKDEDDKKRMGVTQHHWEIKKLIKNNQINELKKKFTLLCVECNVMEGFAKKDSKKTFNFICWLLGEDYLEEALKDDPTLKKLTDFLK